LPAPAEQRRHRPLLRHRLHRVEPMPIRTVARSLRPTIARTVEPADGPAGD